MKEIYTERALHKVKDAGFIDTLNQGYQAAQNFKPFMNASQQFFRHGGMDYLKTHARPIAKKIYNNVGFNNQIKLDYAKNKATSMFNKYIPAIDKVNQKVTNMIPKPIKDFKDARKVIDQGFTNVGKI